MGIAIDETLGHARDATRDSMVAMRLVYAADNSILDSIGVRDSSDVGAMLERAYPWPDRPSWVRANMVVTVDGRAQAGDGLTEAISSAADKRVFGYLRANCDVILVGAGTVRSEGYHAVRPKSEWQARREAEGRRPAPVLAIVSASLDLDPSREPFTAPGAHDGVQRPVILTTADADPSRARELSSVADVVICGEETVDPARAIEALIDRDLPRILCEGGPRLLGDLLCADLIDELDLTISPLLLMQQTGNLVTIEGVQELPRHLVLAHVVEAESTLMLRYLLPRSGIPSSVSTPHPEADIS